MAAVQHVGVLSLPGRAARARQTAAAGYWECNALETFENHGFSGVHSDDARARAHAHRAPRAPRAPRSATSHLHSQRTACRALQGRARTNPLNGSSKPPEAAQGPALGHPATRRSTCTGLSLGDLSGSTTADILNGPQDIKKT